MNIGAQEDFMAAKKGRPRCRTKMTKRLTFRIRTSLYEQVRRKARAERRDVADFVRIAVEDRIASICDKQG